MTVLVTDIIGGFTKGKGTGAVALDVKGAFNALSPEAVLDQLMRIEAPTRIINFVSLTITSRNIFSGMTRLAVVNVGWESLRVGCCPLYFSIWL